VTHGIDAINVARDVSSSGQDSNCAEVSYKDGAMSARKLEEKLARLAAPEVGADELREALRSKTGVLVGAAAKLVAARELAALDAELAPAFTRLCERAVERDPQCRGKISVARALHQLDRWEDEVFVRGVTYVQEEPVWGGREDTAAELRGVCGLAYAHAGRSDALDVLAELLADPQRVARSAAAQAIGDSGRPDATALLRFKIQTGDPEPAVIGACFGSILALAPKTSLAYVAGFLDGADERAEAAALALGESRLAAAAPVLIAWCERVFADLRRRVGYLALALLRDEGANARLLEVIASGAKQDAIAAVRALATFKADPRLRERIRAAAETNRDRAVRAEADTLGPS
jgi:hypothetical protein